MLKKSIFIFVLVLTTLTQASSAKASECLLGSDLFQVLEQFETDSELVVTTRTRGLTDELVKQILVAADRQSIREALKSVDNGQIRVATFTDARLPADYYTAVYFLIGDVIEGAVFEQERHVPVARISDGAFTDCL